MYRSISDGQFIFLALSIVLFVVFPVLLIALLFFFGVEIYSSLILSVPVVLAAKSSPEQQPKRRISCKVYMLFVICNLLQGVETSREKRESDDSAESAKNCFVEGTKDMKE